MLFIIPSIITSMLVFRMRELSFEKFESFAFLLQKLVSIRIFLFVISFIVAITFEYFYLIFFTTVIPFRYFILFLSL